MCRCGAPHLPYPDEAPEDKIRHLDWALALDEPWTPEQIDYGLDRRLEHMAELNDHSRIS